jgi:cell division protein DivIC
LKTIPENNEPQQPSRFEKAWTKFSWARNKYLVTALGFLIWMVFIDRNDLPTQWKRVKELRTLQQAEKTMDRQISETKEELNLLKTNPSTLEKYAREKYMMKKDNEDLYIVAPVKQ